MPKERKKMAYTSRNYGLCDSDLSYCQRLRRSIGNRTDGRISCRHSMPSSVLVYSLVRLINRYRDEAVGGYRYGSYRGVKAKPRGTPCTQLLLAGV